jgi:hypothetical protein
MAMLDTNTIANFALVSVLVAAGAFIVRDLVAASKAAAAAGAAVPVAEESNLQGVLCLRGLDRPLEAAVAAPRGAECRVSRCVCGGG